MKAKFYPGWKMTWGQRSTYFRLVDQVCKAQGATTAAERKDIRQMIHIRAFGGLISAKEIDHMKGFDAFKATCLAILMPADVDAQLRQVEQPLIRGRHACRALADEPYILALVRGPLFNKQALEDLTEEELTRLRNTLADQKVQDRRPGTLPRRTAAKAAKKHSEGKWWMDQMRVKEGNPF